MAKYVPGHIPGVEPRTARLIQQLYEMNNQMSDEIAKLRASMSVTGGAKKENPKPGVITIPSKSEEGQNGLIRVNEDGVIVSYVNPFEGIFPYIDLRTIGNVGAGVDTLHSFTIPAGTLAFDGDYLRIRYKGDFAANANTKRIQGVIGGNVYNNTGLYSISGAEWVWDLDVIRTSSTQVRIPIIAVDGFGDRTIAGVVGGNYLFFAAGTLVTVTNLNTTNVVIEMQAESGAGATDDIIQRVSRIEFYRPRTIRLV